ncbi:MULTISPECIES: 2,3-diaminopropionate biosynthesis protein SbnA [Streptomyces]|uniref:2,3-diaminopropionate biosynthesis protein SbnA n=1 Tax=Streptomyces lonegramiae TaxID=3075524 RepID=A0ABU2X983_9ACTN|nr:2,3-diaminopropionate biosynthesis protein SbnA [Streptomyces sp. DSM 41529]MDT0541513.1 2,3-diaminopropionate biosynthesis protein SbnA [Streptomyces sp. DSM 41529]
MTVITRPEEFNVGDLYVAMEPMFGQSLYLKCEGFNFAGSVKLKAALEMVGAAERAGVLRPGTTIVESSSGNLGVALSIVAASYGYGFVCVTDSRCTLSAQRLMRAHGAEVRVVTEPHAERGLLGARLAYVEQLCRENEQYVWLDQYSNPANWIAHARTTGPEILKQFPELDVLFVGAGTTGTLMGCARHLREEKPSVRIVAIDAEGSVTFGFPPAPRFIPGLGTAVRPTLLDRSYVDEVVLVAEPDTVRTCRTMQRNGFLFGGSTGTVVAGALRWLAEHAPAGDLTAVAIAPDLGERYLDTIYDDEWVAEHFGAGAPAPTVAESATTRRQS